MTAATRAKRHAAAVAAITKRHTRDGDARTRGREWTPAASWHVGAPVCYDARYLLEAFRLLAPAGEPVTWRAYDVANVKRPDGATLLESADGQWAYLVMPIAGDVRAAMALIPGAADARQVAA